MIHESLGFRSLHPIPSLDWALLGYGLSSLYLAYVFLPYVCGLAGASAMPLHCSFYNITYPFALFLLLDLRAETSTMSISYIIPSFGLYYLVLLLGQPIPYLGLPWPISFFRRPRPISSFPTSFTLMGFLAKSFGLPRPNYHILTFWAYWPLTP